MAAMNRLGDPVAASFLCGFGQKNGDAARAMPQKEPRRVLRRRSKAPAPLASIMVWALAMLALFRIRAEVLGADAPDQMNQPALGAVPDPPDPSANETKLYKLAKDILDRDTLTGDWFGYRTKLQDAGIIFSLLDQNEVWGNLSGGLRTGVVYDGLTTAALKLDLQKLFCWPDATFDISALQIHGRGPTPNLTGNLQLISNIEATRSTKLYDLWIEQRLFSDRLSIRIGQEGANDELMLSQYATPFLNSSFGYPGLLTVDLPSGGPNYPLGAPFVRIKLQATPQFSLTAAVYTDDPAPPGNGDPQIRDKSGTAFRLNDGALWFGELAYSVNQDSNAKGLPATYKLGALYTSSTFDDQFYDSQGHPLASPTSTGVPRTHSGGFAVYGLVDQMVWKEPGSNGGGIGLFFLGMGAPQSYNLCDLYFEGGMNWIGPFRGREKDTFGFGAAFLQISPAKRQYGNSVIFYTGTGSQYSSNETVLEAFYICQLTPWLQLQPDAQYVVNPGAGIPSDFSQTPLKNAFIIGIRSSIQF
jgi:porin